MTKVFVLEPTRLDVSAACAYGELVYIFAPGQHRSSIWTPEFAAELLARLSQLGYTSNDYILIAGHVVAVSILLTALVAAYSKVSALAFDSCGRRYVPQTLGA